MMVVVIGNNWLRAAYPDGRRRIDDRNDFVRREIVTALRRKLMILPILVEGAKFPQSYELPPALRPVVKKQYYEMRNASFRRDATFLIST